MEEAGGDYKFLRVDPAKLTLVWDGVKPGLERIKKRGRNATWRIEDVYHALATNRADLYLVKYNGQYCGFVILAVVTESFTKEDSLLVWCAAYTLKRRVPKDTFQRTLEAVYDVARSRGITRVIMHSSRPGWAQARGGHGGLPDPSWTTYETVYERRL